MTYNPAQQGMNAARRDNETAEAIATLEQLTEPRAIAQALQYLVGEHVAFIAGCTEDYTEQGRAIVVAEALARYFAGVADMVVESVA